MPSVARLVPLLLMLAATPVSAGAEPRDHDRVREAVTRGEIRPLADILAAVRDSLPGEIVGVEIERKDGRWMYEFRVLGQGGRLLEIYVDARTASIERIKEK
jgi:uncharacterized membrane protein YkoI